MQKKSIAVIGQGFVGGALTTVISENNVDVYTFDITGKCAQGGIKTYATTLEEFISYCDAQKNFTKIIFVCLPTPMLSTGEADISIVENTLIKISKLPNEHIAVVKSTIPPGSTERWNEMFKSTGLRVIFNPEFLREATALDDMRNQTRIILGGPRPYINKVKQLYESIWNNIPIIKTSSTTAEMVKYVTNIHLAVKVSLANEFYQLCQALDTKGLNIDYDKLIEYALYDERLGKSHWKVPGPMPSDDTGEQVMGFAGSCVVAGTLVSTNNGDILVENICKDDIVVSCDHNVENIEDKSIDKITSRHYEGEVIELSIVDNGITYTVTCTPEHIIPVKRNNVVYLTQAKDIIDTDELFNIVSMDFIAKNTKISSIKKLHYIGKVYNLELNSTRSKTEDDLFWVCNKIVVHNCFVKDLNALIHVAKNNNVDPKVMSAAWEKNLEVRPQRDWEKLIGRAITKIT